MMTWPRIKDNGVRPLLKKYRCGGREDAEKALRGAYA
jgi:hypothetical protein